MNRRSLTKWRKLPGAPSPASNGSHPVNERRVFLRSQGLAGDADDTTTDDIEDLKRRKLLAEVAKREHELGVQQGNYMPTDEVGESICRLVGEGVAVLRNKLEDELPPVLAGLAPSDSH